jgi:3-oxoadipate CoA-transferase, alpha subunit
MRKPVLSAAEAVADIADGSTILAGGFGGSGYPLELYEALADRHPKNLVLVSNNGGHGEVGAARLIRQGAIDKLIATFPKAPPEHPLTEAVESGQLELVLVPQGTLAEAIRAGGFGLGGVLTRTGIGTQFAEGRQVVEVDGVEFLLEPAVRGDVAFIRADEADPYGNLRFRYAQQNFNPFMAPAADITIAYVNRFVEEGLEPTAVHTPGVFVDRIVVGGDA